MINREGEYKVLLFEIARTTVTLIFLEIYMILLMKTAYSQKVVYTSCSVLGVMVVIVNAILIWNFHMPATFSYWGVIICIPVVVLFIILVKHVTIQSVFSGLMAVSFCLVGGLCSRIFYEWHHSLLLYFIIELVIYIGITIFLKYAFCKPYNMIMSYISGGWLLYCLIPASFFCNLYFLVCYPTFLAHWHENIPAVIFTIMGMIAMYFFIYRMFQQIQQKMLVEGDRHVLEIQVSSLKCQIEKFEKETQKSRIYHHDMRHFANIIESHLKHGYIDEAIQTIDKMYGYINAANEIIYCENITINAVIGHYTELGKNSNIQFDIKCNFPKDIPIDELEFSVVIANSIENAITACRAMSQSKPRQIKIRGMVLKSQIMFDISNTYEGEIQYDEVAKLPIRNEPGDGYGCRSIGAFADKYGAQIEYHIVEGIFELKLMLNL